MSVCILFFVQQNGFINTFKFTTNLKVINFPKMGTSLLNILEINNKTFSVVAVQYFRRRIPNNTVSLKVTVFFFPNCTLSLKSSISDDFQCYLAYEAFNLAFLY